MARPASSEVNVDRRNFLQVAAASSAALSMAMASSSARAAARDLTNDRIAVAVVGVRGRGNNLLTTFAGLPDVEVKYICDVDESVLATRVAETSQSTGKTPHGIADFRRALDDSEVDAVVLGTPDHWHAIPAILACQAGKDVYVEKPDGHNILEGRTMVAAAKKHNRVIQLGTQARSSASHAKAMDYIRTGALGRPMMAKAWESTRQSSLGHPADTNPPAGVDYDMWLGPAPKRSFNPARFHGNWRWFLDYGTGDLGNDGVHRLDVARWALETAMQTAGEGPLGMPRNIAALGGKYYFDDDQEWPDTFLVSYDFPGKLLSYEMRIWCPYPHEGEGEGAAVFGDGGSMIFGNSGWRAYDPRGKKVREESASSNDVAHAQNFIECMRSRAKPNADLETVGHVSSLLCHLGNAAWRAGRNLKFDFENYSFISDSDANQYLTRAEYRAPWTLPSINEL